MKKYVVIAWIDNAKDFRITDVSSDNKNDLVRMLNRSFNILQRNVWEDYFGQCFSISESKRLFEERG